MLPPPVFITLFLGSTEEFQNERLKRGIVRPVLAIAMPTWTFGKIPKYSDT